jgi:hypothetical protein
MLSGHHTSITAAFQFSFPYSRLRQELSTYQNGNNMLKPSHPVYPTRYTQDTCCHHGCYINSPFISKKLTFYFLLLFSSKKITFNFLALWKSKKFTFNLKVHFLDFQIAIK